MNVGRLLMACLLVVAMSASAFGQDSLTLVLVGQPREPQMVPKVVKAFTRATGGGVTPTSAETALPNRQVMEACVDTNADSVCENMGVNTLYRQPGNLLLVSGADPEFHPCTDRGSYTAMEAEDQFVANSRGASIIDQMDALAYGKAATALMTLGEVSLPCLNERLEEETFWRYNFVAGYLAYETANNHSAGIDAARPFFLNALHTSPGHTWDADYPPAAQTAYAEAKVALVKEEIGEVNHDAMRVVTLGAFDALTVDTQSYAEGMHLHPGLHLLQWKFQGMEYTRVFSVPEGGVDQVLLLVDGASWAQALLTFPEQRSQAQRLVVATTLSLMTRNGQRSMGVVDLAQDPPLGLLYKADGEGVPLPVDLPTYTAAVEEGDDDDGPVRRPHVEPFQTVDTTPGQLALVAGGGFKGFGPATYASVHLALDAHIRNGFGVAIQGNLGLTSVSLPDGTNVLGDLVSLGLGVWYRFWSPVGVRPLLLLDLLLDINSYGVSAPIPLPSLTGGGGVEVLLPDSRFRVRFVGYVGGGWDGTTSRPRYGATSALVMELRPAP
ncbi:hypothetical protein COV06_01795 [Candidatus Uhrbacteria bacterium CG10_big_fil_rev_8_21_14_0_10_50_16]|uniref:Uncharacterized protein n=1 Tax=Candidatus Uhrbacteria bacterium CG10_big_fil_rev_8_21_14_0_10_50_16 TaxID=1975039 RepID=A0A2H0RMD3_9BACT|nr:MAG: hypothetical protein COV06_01795 [Candidatus Uhrbacteria bacterium CG10_big_fil_rev_8_21_14_0_10_50_16]